MPTNFSTENFREAKFTAVISDLHLTNAEPVNARFPLWKKFKTREFFFDDVFEDFLNHIEEKAGGEKVELILNGAIFDFDSVTTIPVEPVYYVSKLEKQRSLHPIAEKSRFKIEVIIEDHSHFFFALSQFILRGHRVVFVIGNHDLELHYAEVQATVIGALKLPDEAKARVRFVEWFYISNGDTLIEHGNQYDPYCLCEDPINPFVRGYNNITLKLPFGNLACRYIMNGMGFFNPHADSNYIMTLSEYLRFFFKYVARAQPDLILIWFFGSVDTLWHSFLDRFRNPIRNPLRIEDRIEEIAYRSNAEPRMVRELKELFAEPASSNPILLARELWLDRAFLIFIAFFIIFEIMVFVKAVFAISMFWAFVPLFLLLPFFLFYSKSISSLVSSYKEPDDRVLHMTSAIAKVQRVVYGHTHQTRHEILGSVEHLNPGCWSPAFADVECTKPIGQKNFIWIYSQEKGPRAAELIKFRDNKASGDASQ